MGKITDWVADYKRRLRGEILADAPAPEPDAPSYSDFTHAMAMRDKMLQQQKYLQSTTQNTAGGFGPGYPYTGTIAQASQVSAPKISPFDLSQIATVPVEKGMYRLYLDKGETRVGWGTSISVPGSRSAIKWMPPSKLLDSFYELDYLEQDWVDFKSQAIGWIVGKFGLHPDPTIQ